MARKNNDQVLKKISGKSNININLNTNGMGSTMSNMAMYGVETKKQNRNNWMELLCLQISEWEQLVEKNEWISLILIFILIDKVNFIFIKRI